MAAGKVYKIPKKTGNLRKLEIKRLCLYFRKHIPVKADEPNYD
jgi:hypothetical protein